MHKYSDVKYLTEKRLFTLHRYYIYSFIYIKDEQIAQRKMPYINAINATDASFLWVTATKSA